MLGMTGCVCKESGWCERHQCIKTDHWVHLCQTDPDYFAAWENGTGPGQRVSGDDVSATSVIVQEGPGTELHKLLAKFWIGAKGGCNCKKHAEVMNQWGPEICRERLDTILSWLEKEAHERHLPFIRIIAKRLVLKAIRNTEKENHAYNLGNGG
jgi:hypothetical protein